MRLMRIISRHDTNLTKYKKTLYYYNNNYYYYSYLHALHIYAYLRLQHQNELHIAKKSQRKYCIVK